MDLHPLQGGQVFLDFQRPLVYQLFPLAPAMKKEKVSLGPCDFCLD